MNTASRRKKLNQRMLEGAANQRVEEYIRQAIYAGELKPRERVIESDIASNLAVSRGPVREALLRLERDGLVTITKRRGTFIRDISTDEIPAIFAMRAKLEGLCVRYMRQSLTSQGEAMLRKCVRDMKKAVSTNDDELFYRSDMELHRRIWHLSGQPRIYRILELVMNPLIFMIARLYSSRRPIQDRYEDHEGYLHLILTSSLDCVEREVENYYAKLYQKTFVLALSSKRGTNGQSFQGELHIPIATSR